MTSDYIYLSIIILEKGNPGQYTHSTHIVQQNGGFTTFYPDFPSIYSMVGLDGRRKGVMETAIYRLSQHLWKRNKITNVKFKSKCVNTFHLISCQIEKTKK